MKPHYFEPGQESEAAADSLLQTCIRQGYVPPTCLLGGQIVWGVQAQGDDPCAGCHGPRERCYGRPRTQGPDLR